MDELRKRDPVFDKVASLALINPKAAVQFHQTLVQLRGSDGKPENHVRVSTVYACKMHIKEMERAAAKMPSWAVVEFNYGPGPDKIISSG